jgi:hypothetical protein
MPKAFAKVEVNDGQSSISIYVENIKYVKEGYDALAITNEYEVLDLGRIVLNENGRGEFKLDIDEEDSDIKGIAIVHNDKVPLIGFKGSKIENYQDILFPEEEDEDRNEAGGKYNNKGKGFYDQGYNKDKGLGDKGYSQGKDVEKKIQDTVKDVEKEKQETVKEEVKDEAVKKEVKKEEAKDEAVKKEVKKEEVKDEGVKKEAKEEVKEKVVKKEKVEEVEYEEYEYEEEDIEYKINKKEDEINFINSITAQDFFGELDFEEDEYEEIDEVDEEYEEDGYYEEDDEYYEEDYEYDEDEEYEEYDEEEYEDDEYYEEDEFEYEEEVELEYNWNVGAKADVQQEYDEEDEEIILYDVVKEDDECKCKHNKGHNKGHNKCHDKCHDKGNSKCHDKCNDKGHNKCHDKCHDKCKPKKPCACPPKKPNPPNSGGDKYNPDELIEIKGEVIEESSHTTKKSSSKKDKKENKNKQSSSGSSSSGSSSSSSGSSSGYTGGKQARPMKNKNQNYYEEYFEDEDSDYGYYSDNEVDEIDENEEINYERDGNENGEFEEVNNYDKIHYKEKVSNKNDPFKYMSERKKVTSSDYEQVKYGEEVEPEDSSISTPMIPRKIKKGLRAYSEAKPFVQDCIENTRWWKMEINPTTLCGYAMPNLGYVNALNCTMYSDIVVNSYKHRHYLFGVQYDEYNNREHYIYAIPGDEQDIPDEGTTGFTRFQSCDSRNSSMGYWLCFIDSRQRTIVE